jgi:hypothetical protein
MASRRQKIPTKIPTTSSRRFPRIACSGSLRGMEDVMNEEEVEVAEPVEWASPPEPRTRWALKIGVKPKERILLVYAKDDHAALRILKEAGLCNPLESVNSIIPFGGIRVLPSGKQEYVWPEGYEPVLHADNAPSRETRK